MSEQAERLRQAEELVSEVRFNDVKKAAEAAGRLVTLGFRFIGNPGEVVRTTVQMTPEGVVTTDDYIWATVVAGCGPKERSGSELHMPSGRASYGREADDEGVLRPYIEQKAYDEILRQPIPLRGYVEVVDQGELGRALEGQQGMSLIENAPDDQLHVVGNLPIAGIRVVNFVRAGMVDVIR